jgi:hypothetical protein
MREAKIVLDSPGTGWRLWDDGVLTNRLFGHSRESHDSWKWEWDAEASRLIRISNQTTRELQPELTEEYKKLLADMVAT